MAQIVFQEGFENDSDWHHRVQVFPVGGSRHEKETGNIFVPQGWEFFFRHKEGEWSQPEAHHIHKRVDSHRVRGGDTAYMWFGMWRNTDAGLYRRVQVEQGQTVRVTAFLHCWSNGLASGRPDDGRWSDGSLVGYKSVALRDSDIPPLNNNEQNDANGNMRVLVGIDPNGDTDPFAASVVWGEARYIYNDYIESLSVDAKAQSGTVTIFLRSTSKFSLKHLDTYVDDVTLEIVTDPPEPPPQPGRGDPREQYKRTYVLLSPEMDAPWAIAAVEATWDTARFTVGSSADDAGIGNLDDRRIIACNPVDWPGDLRAFYYEYYPGILYLEVLAATPDDLRRELQEIIDEPPAPPPPPPPPLPPPPERPPWAEMEVTSLHVQRPVAHDGYGDLEFVRDVRPAGIKLVDYFEHSRLYKQVSPDTQVFVRAFRDHQGQYWDLPPEQGARLYLESFLDSLKTNAQWIDYAEGLNEIGIATGQVEGIKRHVAFEWWFAEHLAREMGDAVAPSLLAIAVGNPQHEPPSGEVSLLIPAVEQVVKYGGAINYHGYHRVHRKVVDPSWPNNSLHYAHRCLLSYDPVFNAAGLYPNYVLGEAGAFLDAVAGWKHGEVFGGDWGLYGQSLLENRALINAWNMDHNYRCICATLFTYTLADWRHYNLYGYARALTELLGGGAGDRLTHDKSMAKYYQEEDK